MSIEQTTIDLWFHYEQVAMHFNEMIIQYRLQLMGGISAIGTIAGYLVGQKVESPYRRHMLRAYISLGILVIIIAAAILDVYYYNELLRGAVDAILEIESKHDELSLSTNIKARFPNSATTIIKTVYGLLILPLVIFTLWSWGVFLKESCSRETAYEQANN